MFTSLRDKWHAFYQRQCIYEPVRWYWPIIRIYGGAEGSRSTVYMTRVVLLPFKWIRKYGGLYLHIFHREDLDRDPHDHPFGYWTLPINQGYFEEVYDAETECFKVVRAPRLRWSHRPATHIHRVTDCEHGWPLITLVWRGPTKRRWGFWCHTEDQRPDDTTRFWTPWMQYCNGEHANVVGADMNCPGTPNGVS